MSIGATLIVIVALISLIHRSPGQLVRPSVLILIFFCLQIQISSAINSNSYTQGLDNPWIYFWVVHGFSLATLAIVLLTKRQCAEDIFSRVGATVSKIPLLKIVLALAFLMILEYTFFLIYLYHVPFEKTGLYAIFRKPEMLDSYRELSMKLIRSDLVRYTFAVLEKVIAPIAGVVLAMLVSRLWSSGFRTYAVVSLLLFGIVIFPTLIYGARGPAAMVVLAIVFGYFLAFVRRVTVVNFGFSLVLVLSPPVILMNLKSQTFSADAITFQALNVLDRAIGRGYIDNVWHIKRIEHTGFYGVAAIEKLAYFFNLKPIDAFNEVAVENKNSGGSFGISYLEIAAPLVKKADVVDERHSISVENKNNGASFGVSSLEILQPVAKKTDVADEWHSISDGSRCEIGVREGCIDVSLTASSSASFVVMNYAMFGWYGVIISLALIYALDFLLFIYQRMDEVMLVPAIASLIVPAAGLSFSLFTTSLASKGLLLIPLTCLALGWLLNKCLSGTKC